MLTDPSILEAAYQCFLEEAPGLLETIERELFEFSDDTKVESVNSMMRAAHTIKGGAANVGLDTINKIAHYLEDVFKALASPNLEIDEETKSLLLEGYECLRLPLTAELTQAQVDDTEVLERATLVFTRLDEKLGDYIRAAQDAVPTSAELGIDLVQTIFETVVPTHLDELEGALDSADVEGVLRSKVDIFIGFAESLGLPGLGEIANSIQAALDAGSGDAATLARTGLDNFKSAHADVLAGDRDRGGEPSETLLALVAGASSAAANEASGGDLAEANDAEGLATPARNENSQQFTDLDSLFQEPAIANGALDPFAIDEAAIAASADVEAEAMSAEPISPDNPLDSIWGNPIAPEAGAFGEEIGGDLTAAETGANFAANSDNEAAGESPETESQSARDDLDAIFAGNLDAEPNIDLSASPDGEVAETDVDNNLLASLEEAVAGLEVEAPAPQSLVEEPVVEVPKLEKKQARAALKQTVRVELQELETLNYLIGDLLIEQNRNALMGADAKARIDALEEKLQSSKEAIGQAMSWIESSLPPAVPPALESITAAEAAEPVSGDRISAPSTPPSAPAQDLSQVRSTLQQAMAAIADSSETLQKVKLIAKESQLALRKQQRTSLNMRDELLGSRMAPLENVFNRFPYMIQQLASTHGKDVEFVVRGGHILVDKAVEQKLYDPLLHLIRNALDHGIETTEDRRNSGKRETAKIELIAFYQGCQTVIEIRDNGRGIDPRKICNKLVERDLLSPQEVGGLSDSQIIEFLFEPGFSTASSVSDLSGRGVGLDVVRSQVQSLKGSVAIESTLTVGTTFTLQLPLTLNISKLMICEAGGMKYSLLSDTIEKIISPNPDDLSFHEGQQVLHWQSGTGIETIPVRYLRDLVSYTGRGRRPEPQPKHEPSQAIAILLLRSKGDLLGLAIDRVLGEQELVIRPLGSTFVPPPYAYGCSILPDGKLSLVIDPLTLIASQPGDVAHKPNISGTLNILDRDPELPLAAPAAPEEDRPTVATEPELFIIDDSPNARLSLAMSLKKAGYTIHEAEDGLDALEKLKQLNNIGLILCDIDMPRMNGVEFLMARQKEPALKNIPVAMLTSHNAQKYRQLASSLGASAYFTKPYRDEKVLPKVGELLGKPVANPV